MSDYQKITPIANKILQKYDLCDNCLGRLFSKQLHLSSNRLLGKKLKKDRPLTKKCYICKNIFENLNHFLNMMFDTSSNYSFVSFSVGAMIKPSVIDRDDYIRSQYKLRGIDSIKTDFTKELAKSFSKKTKHVVDTLNPEFTFTINLKDESCQIRSKSITIFGRYVKSLRGLAQKQKPCQNCSGKGCRLCNFHGISEFDSIEGLISKFLFEKIGGTTAKFTWIGGEDKPSLVLGAGRPFFVKIQNPHNRILKQTSKTLESLKINNLKIVNESPKKPLTFTSSIKIKITTQSEIDTKNLKKLKTLETQPVVVYDASRKNSEKNIFSVKSKKTSNTEFYLFLESDGGLPVKRFVDGDNVSPGVADILDIKCKCLEFDFLDVHVNDNN